MDARKSAIFEFQFVKPILKTVTHLIQGFSIVTNMVLEIRYWPVKYTTVTVRFQAKISSISIPSHQAMQAIAMIRLYDCMKTNHFKKLLNVFSTKHTYSNCIVYWLFYCWKIT